MIMAAASPTANVIAQPFVQFGREICGDLDAAVRREWLVTNGLGGYASGTVAGINTRSYHGLLVAALTPPVERTVLVGGLVEWATYDGKRYPLCTHEYVSGTIDPRGFEHLQSFALEGVLPVWVYALADALLERRVYLAAGTPTTYVRYRLLRGTGSVELALTPLVTYHSFHALSSGRGWTPYVEAHPQGAEVHAFDGAVPYYLLSEGATFAPGGEWFWDFHYRAETSRGLNDSGDLYAAGTFTGTLRVGDSASLVLTTDAAADLDGTRALVGAQDRQVELLRRAGVEKEPRAVQQLTLAADQFIVARPIHGEPPVDGRTGSTSGRTIIAGYHWFNDWGRDTMISLPGLTLATGRPQDAAIILREFSRFVADGLLPNNFPDSDGAIPGYNTADATLWYMLAVWAYTEATGDNSLMDELLPTLCDMANNHIAGTRYHIGVDAADGLLHAGEPGVQLTWMDAKVGDWVVTPRIGKPVEINALWYNALQILADALAARGNAAAQGYRTLAAQVSSSFHARFLRPDRASLADVVDTPSGDDWTMRPNQIFAVSLPYPLLDVAPARAVVEIVGRTLLTSYGLRSLSPDDPAYRGTYGGNQLQRDGAYHQGPVWTWLMGAYVVAHYRVYQDREAALALLQPFEDHLRDAGLGSISEILEGNPPHAPRGCIAQAWGVAEILRVWRGLLGAQPFNPSVEVPIQLEPQIALR
jgi:predicted glycogen debranching enzyme